MKIIAFTGAGISRESGLKTFRDSIDGLWEGYDIHAVASIQGWWDDPEQVLEFYNMRRREVLAAEPNAAHRALARLEEHHDVTVITQNIDDLHERAGSSHVIHLHGEVLTVRADAESYDVLEWRDDLAIGDADPTTGIQLRPNVVWFGEGLPNLDNAMDAALADDVEVLIVVGTTLNVYPAAFIATESKARRIFVVDPNPPDMPHERAVYYAEPASSGVERVVAALMP